MLKGVFLDLDNTLYTYELCHQYATEKAVMFISGLLNIPEKEIYKAIEGGRYRVQMDIADGSCHSRLLYYQKAIESLTGRTNCTITLRAEELYWSNFLEKMELREGVIELFDFLKRKKVKIIIISELTAAIQMKKLIKLGLDSRIDYLVTSEESDHEKPHPYIFELALEKCGFKPDEVIMIGDDYKKDNVGAQKVNVRGLHFGSEEFSDFEKIKSYLKESGMI